MESVRSYQASSHHAFIFQFGFQGIERVKRTRNDTQGRCIDSRDCYVAVESRAHLRLGQSHEERSTPRQLLNHATARTIQNQPTFQLHHTPTPTTSAYPHTTI